MLREFHMPFVPHELDRIEPGELTLGVPLRSDIIQIGDFSDLPHGRIRIAKDLDDVTTIARQESAELQVEVVYKPGILPGYDSGSAQRMPVFCRPVSRLQVYPTSTTNGNCLWVAAADGLEVADDIDLEKFLLTVGTYALIKSSRLQQNRG